MRELSPGKILFFSFKIIYALILIVIGSYGAFSRRFLFSKIKRKIGTRSRLEIIVNGPCLDLKKIALDSEKLCVNQFATSNEFVFLRPKFYLLIDPKYAAESELYPDFSSAIFALQEKVCWPLFLFIPERFLSSIKSRLSNEYISIVPYPTSPFPASEIPRFFRVKAYRRKWITPPASNVLVHAIYLSISLDYKEVNIHGASFDFFKSVSMGIAGSPVFVREHFYGSHEVPLGMPMSQFFQEQYQSFSSFQDLAEVARLQKVKVINCSPGSMIDSFPRSSVG